MKTLTLLILLTLATTQAQVRDYQYFAVGSSYATIPHTNTFTPNVLLQAGIVYNIWDVSINVELVELEPSYLSYYAQLQVLPFPDVYGVEMLTGIKYGRVVRDGGAYLYGGVQGELRRNVLGKFFVSLVGNYDYRGDINSMWGKDYFVYTTHLKLGIKI